MEREVAEMHAHRSERIEYRPIWHCELRREFGNAPQVFRRAIPREEGFRLLLRANPGAPAHWIAEQMGSLQRGSNVELSATTWLEI